MDFPNTDLQGVVNTYSPIVHLAPTEVCLPASVDWYVSLCGYYDAGTGRTFGPGSWTWSDVPQAAGDYLVGNAASKSPNDTGLATCYVQMSNPEPAYFDLQYWFFYGYNGDTTLRLVFLGEDSDISLIYSEHQGDWEQCTVRVNGSSGSVDAVFLSEHSGGVWLPPSTSSTPSNDYVMLVDGKRPVLFAGSGSHANYPTYPGPFVIGGGEFWGFGAYELDNTGQGTVVDYSQPGRSVVIANNAASLFPVPVTAPPWFGFQGRWGEPVSFSNADVTEWLETSPVFNAAVAGLDLTPQTVALLVDTLIRRFEDGSAPRTPTQQNGWTGDGPLLEWTGNKLFNSSSPSWAQAVDKPALVLPSGGMVSYHAPAPGKAVQQARFTASGWQAGTSPTILGAAIPTDGPVAAVSFPNMVNQYNAALITVTKSALTPYVYVDGGGWTQVPTFPTVLVASGGTVASLASEWYIFYFGSSGGLSYISTEDWTTFSAEETIPGADPAVSKTAPVGAAPAAVSLGDMLCVVYPDQSTEGSSPQLTSVVTTDGSTWSEPQPMGDAQTSLTAALATDGSVIICVWASNQDRGLRYTMSSDGVTWNTESTLIPSQVTTYPPALLFDGAGFTLAHSGANNPRLWWSQGTQTDFA